MPLKPQSIRKGVTIILNGNVAQKPEILSLSVMWNENEIILFKKMLKQGGKFKIGNDVFETCPKDKILNSRGQRDEGVFKVPSVEDRF